MASPAEHATELQALLDERAGAFGVPAAALAISTADGVLELATGTLEVGTDRPATAASLFRLGSVTKVYTATLVMTLVDDGLVELDAPVRRYLPDLRLADDAAASAITVRHLLTHTSGLVGDHFVAAGAEDDCIARYVASLSSVGQVHAPGEMFSYCNSGMILAGRAAEVVTGLAFEDALRTRVLDRAGLADTVALPEEIVVAARSGASSHDAVGRLAVGHEPGPDGMTPVAAGRELAPIWTRAVAPAGSTLAATALDVVRFAEVHLGRGVALLREATVAEMRRPQAPLPARHIGTAIGLGWHLNEIDGHRIAWHAGQHEGTGAMVWTLPDAGLAFSFVTNGPTGLMLLEALTSRLEEIVGLPLPRQRRPVLGDPPSIDLEPYVGSYFPGVEVEADGDALTFRFSGALEGLPQMRLSPIDATTFHVGGAPAAVFLDFDDAGRPGYVHLMNRAYRRL